VAGASRSREGNSVALEGAEMSETEKSKVTPPTRGQSLP
jgi:hypothetical protein